MGRTRRGDAAGGWKLRVSARGVRAGPVGAAPVVSLYLADALSRAAQRSVGRAGICRLFELPGGKVGLAWRDVLRPFGSHASSAIAAAAAIVVAVALLYRRITTIGKISVGLCAIVIATILWLIYGGATHFHPSLVLTFPPGAWNFSWIFFAGLGHASVQGVYSYLGYYNVCNLGGEMKEPERNIPRAIFISIAGVAILYFAMQTSILGVVPWQEAAKTKAVVSLFVERVYGSHWATAATALILITAFGSIFSATLGYSRIPYAAALDGNFFSVFARVHPTKRFPHISLLALGATAIFFCLALSLADVIRAILAMRCLVQFVAQALGLLLLHRRWKAERWPFRMWMYPVPVAIAIAGWIAIFISTGRRPMLASFAAAAAGTAVYLIRARYLRQWPFEPSSQARTRRSRTMSETHPLERPASRSIFTVPRMVRVPEGWFLMGSDTGQDNERPVHRVWVDAFEFAATQVDARRIRGSSWQLPAIGSLPPVGRP